MSAIGTDVLVIGGGLHGLSAALQIARRGKRVVLVERTFIGRHASGATAAGVRTLGRHPEDLDISLEACGYWNSIEALVGDHCGYVRCGQLQVAENEAELRRLEASVNALRSRGYEHERLIGPDELARLVPRLRRNMAGGIWVEQDGAADPHRTLRAFRRACEAAGVAIHENEGVVEMMQHQGRWQVRTRSMRFLVEVVVNAAGAWAHQIGAMAGDPFELSTKASMMIVTERIEPFIGPVLGAVSRPLSFKQTDRGTLVIGGGVQGQPLLDQERTEPDFRRLASVGRTVTHFFPGISPVAINRVWSGLEALTRDHLPVIGYSIRVPGLIHVFGFSGHGFQPVPALGFAVADLAIGGRTDRPIGLLSPHRLYEPSGHTHPAGMHTQALQHPGAP